MTDETTKAADDGEARLAELEQLLGAALLAYKHGDAGERQRRYVALGAALAIDAYREKSPFALLRAERAARAAAEGETDGLEGLNDEEVR